MAWPGCRRRSSAPAVGVEPQGLGQRHQLLAGGLRPGLLPRRVSPLRGGAAPFHRGARRGDVKFPRVVVDRMHAGPGGRHEARLVPVVLISRRFKPLGQAGARDRGVEHGQGGDRVTAGGLFRPPGEFAGLHACVETAGVRTAKAIGLRGLPDIENLAGQRRVGRRGEHRG